MITISDSVNRIVENIYSIYLDKSIVKLSKDEKKIRNMIDEEKIKLKKFVNNIISKTYYNDKDNYGVIDKILEIIITRISIVKMIVKSIREKDKSYNIVELTDIFKIIGNAKGFELNRLSYISPLLNYFIENVEYWFSVKGTDEYISAITKLLFPFTNLTTAKFSILNQKYGSKKIYTVIEFNSVVAKIEGDITYKDSVHFNEYSDLFLKNDSFKSSLPIMSLVSYSDMSKLSKLLRQEIIEILETESYNTEYIQITENYYMSVTEVLLVYLSLINILFNNKGGYVQAKWIDFSSTLSNMPYLYKQSHDYILSILPEYYKYYVDLTTFISKYYVDNISSLIDKDDSEIFNSIIKEVYENNMERPNRFSDDFLLLSNRNYLTKYASYINILVNLKNSIDLTKDILIYLSVDNISQNVCDFLYAINILYKSTGILSYNDLYFLSLEISSKLELSLGIDNVFSTYLSTLNIRMIDISELYDILSAVKPVHLHLINTSFINDGLFEETFNIIDENIDNITDTFNDSIFCIRKLSLCNLLKGSNKDNILNNVDELLDNVFLYKSNDIFNMNDRKIALDSSNIYIDSVGNMGVEVEELTTNPIKKITTYNGPLRDYLVLKNITENYIEVISW